MLRKVSLLSLMMLGLTMGGCGKKTKKDDVAKTTMDKLVGIWTGSLNVRKSGSTDADRAKVSFSFNDKKQYEIQDIDLARKAAGDFFIFEDRSHINMIINKSDFSLFGLEADPRDYAYQFSNDDANIILQADNTSIFLTKASSDDPGAGGLQATKGNWQGTDQYHNDWYIAMTDSKANISIRGKGPEVVVLGDFTVSAVGNDNKSTGNLIVTSMTPTRTLKSIGLAFDFGSSPNQLAITPVNASGTPMEPITCIRK